MTDEYVKGKISELRMRLLDLTNRNALLNFRHSEKALTHIRIIDELPDFLFGSLLNGDKLTFKPPARVIESNRGQPLTRDIWFDKFS